MKSLIEHLRTLLILGRVSNLPTVWSNLLVGWTIADGPRLGFMREGYGPDDSPWPMLYVLLGGSCLYVGGMYLNDYCDAAFDARYCLTRPIPANKIARRIVGLVAVLLFAIGFACFTPFGPLTIAITLLLIVAILLYDFHHKNVTWAPVVMGSCRCLLYLLAASAVQESYYFSTDYGNWWGHALDYFRNGFGDQVLWLGQWALPAAIPLGLYVAAISYFARGESRPDRPTRWPYLLLSLAVVFVVGSDILWMRSLRWLLVKSPTEFLSILLFLLVPCLSLLTWMAWLLIPFWRKINPSIGRVVSGLLAGIVLFDMIVVVPRVGAPALILFPLFLLALLLQRVIPAT